MRTQKAYPQSNSVMLFAAKTITQSFTENIEIFSILRNNWTPEYASDLARRIDEAIDTYMELDKRKDLKNATAYLSSIAIPAMKNLSLIRTMIKFDFKEDAPNWLRDLGLKSQYFKAKRTGSQEAMIATLVAFQTGMTEEIKTKMISKGIKPEMIEQLIQYSQELRDANMIQEVLKESSKKITDEAKKVFNGIYNEIMNICKVGYNYYASDPIIRQQFNFTNILRNMSATSKTSSGQNNSNSEIEAEIDTESPFLSSN